MQEFIPVDLSIDDSAVRRSFEDCLASVSGFRLNGHGRGIHGDGLLIHKLRDDAERDLLEIRSRMERSPGLEVFLVSDRLDHELLLLAMRSGVKEFFRQPPGEEEVKLALLRLKERRERKDPGAWDKRGVLIDIIGAKAGTGMTTTAVNLAAALVAQNGTSSVALVDMNMPYGEAAIFLDLKPKHTLRDIVGDVSRLDSSYIMGSLTRHPSGLYVLPAPTSFDMFQLPPPEVISRLLSLMRSMFDYVVIDGGEYVDEATLKAMELADQVFFVTQQSVPHLAGAKRYLKHLGRSAVFPEEKIRIILNRYSSASEVTDEDVQEALARVPHCRIPDDGRAVLSALNQGRTLVDSAPKSMVTKCIAGLARELVRESAPAKDEKRLLGIFSRAGGNGRRA